MLLILYINCIRTGHNKTYAIINIYNENKKDNYNDKIIIDKNGKSNGINNNNINTNIFNKNNENIDGNNNNGNGIQ